MPLNESPAANGTTHLADHAALRTAYLARNGGSLPILTASSSAAEHRSIHATLHTEHNALGAATTLPTSLSTSTTSGHLAHHAALHKAQNLRVLPGAMPLADEPGWTRVFADDFLYDFPVGSITPNSSANLVSGPAASTVGAKFTFYPDGWATTHHAKVYPVLSNEPGYIQPGQPGYPAQYAPINARYYPSKVLSFSPTTGDGTANGVMKIRQHSQIINGVETSLGAAIKPKHPSGSYMTGPYGRYAFRMRVQSAVLNGIDYAQTNNFTTSPSFNHIHVPLAIDSNNWPQNGEFNHPDGDVNRKIKGTYHPAAAQNESWSYEPSPPMSPFLWHTYEVIWEPGRARFLIDGVAIKDTTDRVPTMQMAMVIFQHEANWRQSIGDAITEIDWVVMWDYTP